MKIFTLSFLTIILSIVSICNAQVTEMWGVTERGGTYDEGVVYKVDQNGNNFQIVKDF